MQARQCFDGWVAAWRWWMVLALLVAAVPAAAQERVTDKAYWHEEPCVAQALDRLPQHAFVAYHGVLALGYGRCAVWVRLSLAPAPGEQTVLRIRPTYLDEVALHDALQPSVQLQGDRHPTEAGRRSRVITFTVPGGDAPRVVWLRLSTSSTRLLDVQAMAPREAQAQDLREDWLQGIFLMLLAAPWLWASMQWFHTRERVVGAFAVKQAAVLAWALLLLGYGPGLLGALLAPASIDRLTSVLVLGTVAASVWFDRALLASYEVPRWGLRVLLGLVALLPLELAMLFTGHASEALCLNIGAAWLSQLVVVGLYLAAPQVAPGTGLQPRALALLYLLILACITLAAGSQLGLLQGGTAALTALYGHGLLTGVVMLVLLNFRAGQQARALVELAAERARTEQERRHREEQQRLVGMLVHEMKTPLAAVRMLLGDGHPSPGQLDSVQRSLADMNGLLERCAHASQMEGGSLQPQWEPCNLWVELQDIVGRWRDAPRIVQTLSPALAYAPVVQADVQWLRIIIGNLLDNACKYSPPGSRVQIELGTGLGGATEGPHEGLALTVANLPGAAGWPDAEQLFGKYYRGPFARRTTGSGLGLYLVAGLAQSLHGHIRYAPTPEQIRFRLWLPVA